MQTRSALLLIHPTHHTESYYMGTNDDNDLPSCQTCSAAAILEDLRIPAAVGILAIVLFASFLLPATRQRWAALRDWLQLSGDELLTFAGKLGILFTTFQTISLLSENHAKVEDSKSLPPAIRAVIKFFSFTTLEIGIVVPTSSCFFDTFEDELMAKTILFVTIIALFLAAFAHSKAKGHPDPNVHLRRLVNFVKMFLPMITRTLFQALSCATYEGGAKGAVTVLFVDHAVNCNSAPYSSMRAYALVSGSTCTHTSPLLTPSPIPPHPQFMIAALPVGLSLVALVGLWRLRSNLQEVHRATTNVPSTELAAEVQKAIDNDPQLKSSGLKGLFDDYRPQVGSYYDIGDMLRRLMLTCVTVVVKKVSSFFLISLTTSILAIAVHNLVQPLVDDELNAFVIIEHWLVLLVLQIMVSEGA